MDAICGKCNNPYYNCECALSKCYICDNAILFEDVINCPQCNKIVCDEHYQEFRGKCDYCFNAE